MPWSNSVQYVGVTLDCKDTFTLLVKERISKGETAYEMYKVVVKSMLKLYIETFLLKIIII